MRVPELDRVLPHNTDLARSSSPVSRHGRQKVAILSTWHPEPADNGRKLRTRFMIDALSTHHDVVLVSIIPEKETGASLPSVPGVWRQYVLPMPVFRPGSLTDALRGVSLYPRSISATWSRATARSITDLVSSHRVRVVIGTDLRTLRYLQAVDEDVPILLDEPDVSPFVRLDGQRSMRASIREWKYRRLLERGAPRLSSAIVASLQEAAAYRALAGGGHVTIIENGVSNIPAEVWTPNRSRTLLYTGSPRYGPNEEAITYFVRRILPSIETDVGEISVTVTGDCPAEMAEALCHPHVHLTGRLDNLNDVYLQSRLFIAPILSGTGTRIKLLEAMAHGMPVVSTTKGAEGLPVEHGKHLLLADDPADFASAVCELLNDERLACRLGSAGRRLIEERFTWEEQSLQLRTLVGQLMDGES
jgi:polysaccharide biosynthesis protein PslH